jgi:hypothetical protein
MPQEEHLLINYVTSKLYLHMKVFNVSEKQDPYYGQIVGNSTLCAF